MQAVVNTLQNIGIFLLYLAARFAVLLVVLAVLTVVFVAGLAVVRLAGRARRHAMGLARVDGLDVAGGRLLLARPRLAAAARQGRAARRPRRSRAARARADHRGDPAGARPAWSAPANRPP